MRMQKGSPRSSAVSTTPRKDNLKVLDRTGRVATWRGTELHVLVKLLAAAGYAGVLAGAVVSNSLCSTWSRRGTPPIREAMSQLPRRQSEPLRCARQAQRSGLTRTPSTGTRVESWSAGQERHFVHVPTKLTVETRREHPRIQASTSTLHALHDADRQAVHGHACMHGLSIRKL